MAPDPGPFLLVWGLLLVPTFLVWTCFIIVVQAASGQRYVTYSVGLGALFLSRYLQFTDQHDLGGELVALERGALERHGDLRARPQGSRPQPDPGPGARRAAHRPRRAPLRTRGRPDAIGTIHRLQPGPLWRSALRLAPFAVVPLAAGIALWLAVRRRLPGRGVREEGAGLLEAEPGDLEGRAAAGDLGRRRSTWRSIRTRRWLSNRRQLRAAQRQRRRRSRASRSPAARTGRTCAGR